MLPPNQRLIEQSNFAYSPLRKALEKQIKAIEDKKQPDNKKQRGNNKVFLSK